MSATPTPTDHLAGLPGYTAELLQALSDELLDEQIEYYRAMRGATAGKQAYHYTNQLSAAIKVRDERVLGIN